MKKFLAPLIAAVAVVSFGTSVRADPSWTYNWSTTQGLFSTGGNYSLNVTPYTGLASGTSDIIAANLTIVPINTAVTPSDTIVGTLKLMGSVGGHNVEFDFGINTTITGPNTITSVYPVSVTPVGPTSWVSDGDFVKVVSITLPGAINGDTQNPSGTGVGSIALQANGSGSGSQPNPTPEPSTMLLSCVGLAFGGIATWRKRKMAIAA